jgi:hypothetical protein
MNTILEEAEQYEFTNGKYGFIAGAKWQKEKNLYSEEDMNDYANYRLLFKKPIEPKEWFKQFKNK